MPIMPTGPETRIPDTLDLVERADFVINAITRCTNPEAEHAVYFYTNLYRNPPTMIRQIPLYGKFIEGLALARLMTGSTFNQHVDRIWQEALLRELDEEKPVLAGPRGRQTDGVAGNPVYNLPRIPCWKELGESAIRRALDAAVHKGQLLLFSVRPARHANRVGGDASRLDTTGRNAVLQRHGLRDCLGTRWENWRAT